jgi:hypothetical protein
MLNITTKRTGGIPLLANGQVLVMCGDTDNPSFAFTQNSAELYNPATGSWALTPRSWAPARSCSREERLASTRPGPVFWRMRLCSTRPNGQVLAAGGEIQNKVGKFSITASAELCTP